MIYLFHSTLTSTKCTKYYNYLGRRKNKQIVLIHSKNFTNNAVVKWSITVFLTLTHMFSPHRSPCPLYQPGLSSYITLSTKSCQTLLCARHHTENFGKCQCVQEPLNNQESKHTCMRDLRPGAG